MVYISKGKNNLRASHWNNIRTRVRTHEGELLSGKAGERYQERYAREYLGKDLSVAKRYTKDDVSLHERKTKSLNEKNVNSLHNSD